MATLYVGKLIIDEVLRLAQAPQGPARLGDWLAGGLLDRLAVLLVLEFGLAVLSDVLGRAVSLAESLLSEKYNEAHFNAQSYSLDYARTPQRRELDYVRQTGASVDTAKEVKIFGLHAFLIERYRTLSAEFYEAHRRLAVRRAGWGGLLTALGTAGYYLAYAFIAWRTLRGDFTIGDLTFLAGSFRRLRNLLEGLLTGFSQMAGQALYLDDLFSFFEITPEIVSPPQPRTFPTPVREGFTFEDVGFRYPGAERAPTTWPSSARTSASSSRTSCATT